MSHRFASLFAVALAGSLLPATGCHQAASLEETAEKPPVNITVAKAEARMLDTSIGVVGTLKGWEEVEISAKRSGHVLKTPHDVGDRVKPAEVLVQLDPVDTDLMLQQAERRLQAELARLGVDETPREDFDVRTVPQVIQAQVAYDRAVDRLNRQKKLKQQNVSTDEVFLDAEFGMREAQAALETATLAARTTLAMAQAANVEVQVASQARRDMDIAAPEPSLVPEGISGPLVYAITKRNATEGQMIQPGDPVAHLVIEDPLRAWANVPERYAPYVTAGQVVKFTVASHPDRVFEGAIRWVNPAVDERSRTFVVEVLIHNTDRALRPGSFAKLDIVVQRTERTVVPAESVVRFAGVTKLFVVRDQKAVEVPVSTGPLHEGWLEVAGEVHADDVVVTSGQSQLADGAAVVVRASSSPEQPAAAQTATAPHPQSKVADDAAAESAPSPDA
ncbi:MAG: efflux RND transporter periplasmic adaptor subunit [Pirellulales bacterium]|nr:efflux RND transporter periplasmic adaptor subunit [Pirellulales bacterium]